MDDGSDLSQRILRAARQLFFARGYVDTSLRAIATEAGTSESGILRTYRSKGGLLRAVYASLWAEVNVRIDEAMSQAAPHDPSAENPAARADAGTSGRYSPSAQISSSEPVRAYTNPESTYTHPISRSSAISTPLLNAHPLLCCAIATSPLSPESPPPIAFRTPSSTSMHWYIHADSHTDPPDHSYVLPLRFFLYIPLVQQQSVQILYSARDHDIRCLKCTMHHCVRTNPYHLSLQYSTSFYIS